MPTTVIREIISTQSLISHFQPVVSIKKRAVVGLESLARGMDGPVNRFSPEQMFGWAEEANLSEAFDDLCRVSALKAFAALPNRTSLALFLNLDATRLSRGKFSAETIRESVDQAGLLPRDVVLEFSDLDFERAPGLRFLIEACQSHGFCVALDDLDCGSACMRRVADLKPNVVKVDDHVVLGLSTDPIRRTLFQALAALARRQGALTVAEGVENEDDAVLALELGADLLQGFHFGRPQAGARLALSVSKATVERSAMRVKAIVAGRTQVRQRENERHLQMMEKIRQALQKVEAPFFTPTLDRFVDPVASLECLFVVDSKGVQKTPTVVWKYQRESQRSRLFVPAEAGADHSLKDYYLGLTLGTQDPFISEQYVSLATGNLCRTLASRFNDASGKEYILCMDTRSV
ncbi:MAG TPA: EAL domain-containing protein [bacterium]|jgi:EAL domain-containing protein (putative c-di-GMP-specific phosphodiesterase class I)|nr:EAL domain-containing protein [bacterium]